MPGIMPHIRIVDAPVSGSSERIQRDWQGPGGWMQLEGSPTALYRAHFSERAPTRDGPAEPVPSPWHQADGWLDIALQGTALQRAVWQALTHIPFGSTISYSALARWVGRPTAVRAVASAVAANPLPVLLPCHRVIRHNGALGHYIAGTAVKRQLLEYEHASDSEAS